MKPETRVETFLAKIGGQDVEPPDPITRVEFFLQKIIDSGGGGGGDVDIATYTDLVNELYS